MKISDMINELNRLMNTVGDIEIKIKNEDGTQNIYPMNIEYSPDSEEAVILTDV